MNKCFLSFCIIFSLNVPTHAFEIKSHIESMGTRIKNVGKITKNTIISIAEETARTIYTESVASLGEHAVASLIQRVPLTLNRSKKSRLLCPKNHARIYKTFVNNFLKEFLPPFDIDAEQFINDLPHDTTTKNEYKIKLYEKLYMLTVTTEHSRIDENFKIGFSQYKKQHKYDETLKCYMKLHTVATILVAGSLCKLSAECLMHIIRLLKYRDSTPFYFDFLRDLFLNPNNELLFHGSLIGLETLFPSSPSSQGTYIWKYGLKSSDITIKKAEIIGSLITASLFAGKAFREAQYGNIDFLSLIFAMKIAQDCYEKFKTLLAKQESEPKATHY